MNKKLYFSGLVLVFLCFLSACEKNSFNQNNKNQYKNVLESPYEDYGANHNLILNQFSPDPSDLPTLSEVVTELYDPSFGMSEAQMISMIEDNINQHEMTGYDLGVLLPNLDLTSESEQYLQALNDILKNEEYIVDSYLTLLGSLEDSHNRIVNLEQEILNDSNFSSNADYAPTLITISVAKHSLAFWTNAYSDSSHSYHSILSATIENTTNKKINWKGFRDAILIVAGADLTAALVMAEGGVVEPDVFVGVTAITSAIAAGAVLLL